jgi:hypothetical protein
MSDERQERISGEIIRKKKSRKTKIIRCLDCLENDLKSNGCQEMEEESRRQIRMGYHSEGGTG